MGGCVGTQRRQQQQQQQQHHRSGRRSGNGRKTGRNEPLKKERPKWKSDYPMTDGQLRSKRDEFWDTAPAFEGRKEIWDALKAAAYAIECNDHELAQAIVDGASITLPHGQYFVLDNNIRTLSICETLNFLCASIYAMRRTQTWTSASETSIRAWTCLLQTKCFTIGLFTYN
ncbi:ubiquitin domain-containing protein 1 [Rhincodon typus]|uniref:ubiquitin domain-containing protein 1 n=1 Tax=Rhincodon typus TaxID=259920 RepID=UPI00202F8B28|nr:ubiquitin domain-containing protein 1 [Rhincodon typus]